MGRFEIHSGTGGRPGEYRAFERGPLMDIIGWGIAIFAFLLVSGAVFAGLLIATVFRLIGWLSRLFFSSPQRSSVNPSPAAPTSSIHEEEIIEGEFRILSDNSKNDED